MVKPVNYGKKLLKERRTQSTKKGTKKFQKPDDVMRGIMKKAYEDRQKKKESAAELRQKLREQFCQKVN